MSTTSAKTPPSIYTICSNVKKSTTFKENNDDCMSTCSSSSSSSTASSSCLSFSNFNANQFKQPLQPSLNQQQQQQQQFFSMSHSTSSSNSTITTTINPFEETNKFRLEQSVLSPNLFHVASTSTPERDTNCLWNIDQRAVLYPADIPTDESSLIAQYAYDHKLSKQVSAAVEAFWSQNKIIIESPLAGAASISLGALGGSGSGCLRNRLNANSNSGKSKLKGASFNVNSPLTYATNNNNNVATPTSSSSRCGSSNCTSCKNSNSVHRQNHLNRFKQQHEPQSGSSSSKLSKQSNLNNNQQQQQTKSCLLYTSRRG